jgi:L,D-transpeptidase ErfK/SrfK
MLNPLAKLALFISFVPLSISLNIIDFGLSAPAIAQIKPQDDNKPESQDSEAKVIEKLKILALNEPATIKRNSTLNSLKISKLENADRFLYAIQPNVRLVLKLSDRRVSVFEDDKVKASYPVAVGKSGWETPKGKFQVSRLERNPSWQSPWTNKISPPGDNNPIGSRWIGFWSNGKDEIGFHGTPNEGSIGQAASHGCVRMLNRDVKALFELVKLGTQVEVLP